MEKVALGSKAPDFELEDQNGKLVKLSDFIGKKNIVLYFYPKDETPGCTKEACGFRDQYEDFTAIGAEVIGVSADSVESHKSFAMNRKLPFILLSDTQNEARKKYGVKGSLLGLLPGRETFVIDKQGIIRHRFSSQFQIDNHINDALNVVKSL
jgi:peroxiredoxin Q/BCP